MRGRGDRRIVNERERENYREMEVDRESEIKGDRKRCEIDEDWEGYIFKRSEDGNKVVDGEEVSNTCTNSNYLV